MSSYGFHTLAAEVAKDLSSNISGKTILVTGVSPKGLGASLVETIAPHGPKLLILAGRSMPKIQETAKKIQAANSSANVRCLELDLNSQKQIRTAAAEVNAYGESIDVLVNNAGIMARPYEQTEDGLESQFGIMHVGHFLFTNLIINKILASQTRGRVVSISSNGYCLSPIRFADIGFDGGKTYNNWRAYGQAKTANVLFAVSLARKLGKRGLTAFSLHPGAIPTNLSSHMERRDEEFKALANAFQEQGHEEGWWKSLPYKTPEQGTSTHVRAAFDPSIAASSGSYLSDCNILPPEKVRSWARDEVEAEMLWKVSEDLVGQKFQY